MQTKMRNQTSAAEDALLARTTEGRAMRCSCCDRVEVTLGNAILSLGLPDLASVLEVIESFDIDDAPESTRGEREYVIRTEAEQVSFAFSRDEVAQLRELVTGARARLLSTSGPGLPIPSDGLQILH